MPDDRVQCDQCDFKTRVRKYLKSHRMSHEGQYKCQRGCNEMFKSWKLLDEHQRNKHSAPPIAEFKCDKCNSTFSAIHHLRQHAERDHAGPETQRASMRCEQCGFKIYSQQQLQKHMNECRYQFQRASNNICRYFVNGGCAKCDQCVFLHPEGKQFRSAPPCRNGIHCKYLAIGVCVFFPRGNGVQQLRGQQSDQYTNCRREGKERLCSSPKDCVNVPFCPFQHYEEDFPELAKTRAPTIGGRMWDWQDY